MKEASGVSAWSDATMRYLQDRWVDLVVPSLVIAGYQFVLIFVLMFCYIGFIVSMVLVEQYEWAPMVGGGVGFGVSLIAVELGQPLQLGLYRAVLKSMRGEKPGPADVFGGFSSAGSAFVLSLLTFAAVMTGMLFCYIPGLVIGFFLSLSRAALAERDQGALDAMGTSYDLLMSRPTEAVLWYLLRILVIFVVALVPLVGTFLALPIAAVMDITLYLFLQREREPRS